MRLSYVIIRTENLRKGKHPITSNFHTHTNFSGDSSTPARAQIAQAIHLSMSLLYITDHHNYDVHPGNTDFNLSLEECLSATELLRQEYTPEVQLLTDVELGSQPHLGDYFDELLTKYSFDLIIGSAHLVNGLDPYHPRFFGGWEEVRTYEEYSEVLLQSVKTLDQLDVVDHTDYIVYYGPSKNRFYRYETYEGLLEELLKTIISKGKGVECNIAGFRKGLKQPNPHSDVPRRYRELGGEIVAVSPDAHIPDDLRTDFELTRQVLLTCGYHYYTTYEKRKPVFHHLP